jgi:hypothetical protein
MNDHRLNPPGPDLPAGLTVSMTLPNPAAEIYAAVVNPRAWWLRSIAETPARSAILSRQRWPASPARWKRGAE